ncbi:beta-N-acetylglucosaminidase [hydrothermal vent metagenome]|uniref:beta-N-acetylhexosaminidase n=1 Tax=hydrothermal vent metagenome TaxID=652676 RepID=A0A3B0XJW9_9ZZZZ
MVAVDHEGGRVQRFHEGFTQIPAAAVYGKHYTQDKQQAKLLARECGWLMAAECRGVGIDISFAPVLDIGKGVSGVIGDRAYHSKPEKIAELAHEYMSGMREAGMSATGKHFPGHGSVKEDSHTAQPIDERPFNDILMKDIIPFERMIYYGLAGIMPAHVIYPAIDELPAGYSKVWLQQVLRQRLNFQGMIFSDDLSMQAAGVAGDFSARASLALQAGCDMVLVCNHSRGAQQVLESLENYANPASQVRLIRMHGASDSLDRQALMASKQWRRVVDKIKRLGDAPNLELDV